MVDDAELLRGYAEEKSEEAFRALVDRYLDFVYSAALRRVGGDAHAAADVAQQVFTAVAREARSLAQPGVVLPGWLYRTTRNIAVDFVRSEQRRRRREVEAHLMSQNLLDTPAAADWDKLRPLLDAALEGLGERDRQAVLLRYFAQRPFADIGAALRVSEDAARMRVERALEKLRALLQRRGLTSTSAALALALSNNATMAAPAGMAGKIAGASLAAGSVAGASASAVLGGFVAMTKIKTGIAAAISAVVATSTLLEWQAHRALAAELGALRATSVDTRALRRDNERLEAELRTVAGANPDLDEIARLRQRAAVLTLRPPGVVDAEFKPATTWRNVGRATALAANETFHWALFHNDVAAITSFIMFDDDTPENRAAFMAKLSPAVRARYPTPELACAAAFFGTGAGLPSGNHPDDAFQVIGVQPDDRSGVTNVITWYRSVGNGERRGNNRWLATRNGFVLQPHTLAKDADFVVGRFNPATGELLPRPRVEIDPRTGQSLPAKK